MAILSLLNPFGWFGWGGPAKLSGGNQPSGDYGASYAGKAVTPERALELAVYWACVKIIAQTIGTLSCRLYNQAPDGSRTPAIDNPLYDLLLHQPNADHSAVEFWEGIGGCLAIWGNSFALKAAIGGRLVALQLLQPWRMQVLRDDLGEPVYRYNDPVLGLQVYGPDDLMVVRGFGLCDLTGFAPIQFARQTIGSAIAADEAAGSMFRNGMRMSGWFRYKGGSGILTQPQQEDLRAALVKPHIGSENTGKVGILPGDIDWLGTAMKPVDAEFLDSRRMNVEEICRFFGVPPILVGHSAQGQTMWGCLPAGTKVLTINGPVDIEAVRAGDIVWSMLDKGMVKRRVVRSGQTGVLPTLKIRTRDRTVEATANHEFFVRRKHSAPRAGRGGYHAIEWRNGWVRADQLTTEDYAVSAHGLQSKGVTVAPNGRHLTSSFMAFCGLYVAEGSMGPRAVLIARHADASYMDAYRDAMRREFSSVHGPVVLQEYERMTGFSSVSAVRELKLLGFSGTAHTKRVPGWVFGLDRDLQLAFLRGYLDGDGSVDRHGWITWTSVNRDLIDDVRHLCIVAGIPCGEPCDYPIKLKFSGEERKFHGVVWQAWSFSAKHNMEIGSFDSRYIERWDNAPQPKGKNRFDPSYEGRGKGSCRPGVEYDIDGTVLCRITEIIKLQEAVPVFDIEVEETHNFVANGLVVHNSGVDSIVLGFMTTGLRPYLKRIEAAISRDIIGRSARQSLVVSFDVTELLRGDNKGQAEVDQSLANTGIKSRNEIRAERNLPPKPGGDTLTVQAALVPIEDLGKIAKLPNDKVIDPGADVHNEEEGTKRIVRAVLRELKFNPNHGPDGRFASAEEGSTEPKKPLLSNRTLIKTGILVASAAVLGAAIAKSGAKPFRTAADTPAHDVHRAFHNASLKEPLSDVEKKSIHDYTAYDFGKINKSLRLGSKPSEQISNLDAALDKSSLSEDHVVFRGINADRSKRLLQTPPGQMFLDRGFVSTTTQEPVARRFSQTVGGAPAPASKRGFVVSINVDKGANALPLHPDDVRHPEEYEVLLPRSSAFKMLRVDHDTKTIYAQHVGSVYEDGSSKIISSLTDHFGTPDKHIWSDDDIEWFEMPDDDPTAENFADYTPPQPRAGKAFDPNEARDPHGEWTSEGAASDAGSDWDRVRSIGKTVAIGAAITATAMIMASLAPELFAIGGTVAAGLAAGTEAAEAGASATEAVEAIAAVTRSGKLAKVTKTVKYAASSMYQTAAMKAGMLALTHLGVSQQEIDETMKPVRDIYADLTKAAPSVSSVDTGALRDFLAGVAAQSRDALIAKLGGTVSDPGIKDCRKAVRGACRDFVGRLDVALPDGKHQR